MISLQRKALRVTEGGEIKRTLERLPKQRYNSAEVRHLFKRTTKVVKELENFSKSEVSDWGCSLCLVRPTRGR